jgi:hypothetical protein|tara:strand:+ start:9656 stop:9817 length:162 start_codon:yes stop_codon:yes gene_type:complete
VNGAALPAAFDVCDAALAERLLLSMLRALIAAARLNCVSRQILVAINLASLDG